MFTNAFSNPSPFEAIELVACEQPPPKPGPRWVRRTIGRWQTRAFVQEAIDRLELSGHYELASLALGDGPHALMSSERRRVYERMRLAGEPRIEKQLELLRSGQMSETGQWIQRAMELAPGIDRVLREPIWRLLDPAPLTHVAWHELGEIQLAHVATSLPVLPPAPIQVFVPEDPTEPHGAHTTSYLATSTKNSRWGLCGVLMQLRRWELNGQLVDYYLNLVEALERLKSPDAESDLVLLQPECGDYLATCFGRVHIGFPHAANYEYQRQRLISAHDAFWAAKGRQVPSPRDSELDGQHAAP